MKLPKLHKTDHHSVIHYQIGDKSTLHLKKPNMLEENKSEEPHVHNCTSFRNGQLTLDVRRNWGLEFMKEAIDKFYLPSINCLEINFLDKDAEVTTNFLSNCILYPMYNFHLNAKALGKYQMKKKLDFELYKPWFFKTIKNVKESVKLGFFHVKSDFVNEIVQKWNHLTQFLEFEDCKIHLDAEFNFGQCEYDIDVLSFKNSKLNSSKGSKAAVKSLIHAIANSNLKHSLKEIRRSGCNMSETIFEDLLLEYDLDIQVNSSK